MSVLMEALVKASVNNLNDDVNFKHIIEHALSCTLERVDKDVSDGWFKVWNGWWELHDQSNKKRNRLSCSTRRSIEPCLARSVERCWIKQGVQNKSVASLEAHSTEQVSGSVERKSSRLYWILFLVRICSDYAIMWCITLLFIVIFIVIVN